MHSHLQGLSENVVHTLTYLHARSPGDEGLEGVSLLEDVCHVGGSVTEVGFEVSKAHARLSLLSLSPSLSAVCGSALSYCSSAIPDCFPHDDNELIL